MKEREVLRLALEVLEYHTAQTRTIWETEKAIDAIKKILAQPEQEPDEVDIRSRLYQRIHELETQLTQPEQEPVAWRVSYPDEPELGFWFAEGIGGEGCLNEPLYTTPPQRKWVGLTDEEKNKLVAEAFFMKTTRGVIDRVEAALKEKNV